MSLTTWKSETASNRLRSAARASYRNTWCEPDRAGWHLNSRRLVKPIRRRRKSASKSTCKVISRLIVTLLSLTNHACVCLVAQLLQPQTTLFTRVPTTLPVTRPITIGMLSDDYSVNLCVDDTRNLACPAEYIIVVSLEYLVFSRTSCSFTDGACREPTNLVSNECNGRQACGVALGQQIMSACGSQYANGLDLTFNCVPGLLPTLNYHRNSSEINCASHRQ